jgi:hypothetical protein
VTPAADCPKWPRSGQDIFYSIVVIDFIMSDADGSIDDPSQARTRSGDHDREALMRARRVRDRCRPNRGLAPRRVMNAVLAQFRW